MQWMFDIVIEQMLNAGFINDWARARIWQSSVQIVGTNLFTRVDLQTTEFENRVTVDLPFGKLTIQDDGYYLIQGYITVLSMPDLKRVHASIKVNNFESCYGVINVSRATTGNPSVLCSTVRYLQAGDFLQLWVFQDSGVNKFIQAADYATWMDCHRLS